MFFEPMISELQSLPGDLDHLISMTQFMYCVVTAQIGISLSRMGGSKILVSLKPQTSNPSYLLFYKTSEKTESQKS